MSCLVGQRHALVWMNRHGHTKKWTTSILLSSWSAQVQLPSKVKLWLVVLIMSIFYLFWDDVFFSTGLRPPISYVFVLLFLTILFPSLDNCTWWVHIFSWDYLVFFFPVPQNIDSNCKDISNHKSYQHLSLVPPPLFPLKSSLHGQNSTEKSAVSDGFLGPFFFAIFLCDWVFLFSLLLLSCLCSFTMLWLSQQKGKTNLKKMEGNVRGLGVLHGCWMFFFCFFLPPPP